MMKSKNLAGVAALLLGAFALNIGAAYAKPKISKKLISNLAKSYGSISNNDINKLDPYFDGTMFIIPNYDDKTFSINKYTSIKTKVTPWTLTNVSRKRNTINLGSITLLDKKFTNKETISFTAWLAQRTAYLSDQGASNPAIQAVIDLRNCGRAAKCKDLNLDLLDIKLKGKRTFTVDEQQTTKVKNSSKTRVKVKTSANQTITRTVTTEKRVKIKKDIKTDVTLKGKLTVKSTTQKVDGEEGVKVKTTARAKVEAEKTKQVKTVKKTYKRKKIEVVTETYVREQDDAYWDTNYSPIIFFEFNQQKQITSLDTVAGWVRSGESPRSVFGGKTPTLQYANTNRNYRVVHNGQMNGGLGVAATWNKVNSTIRHMNFTAGTAVIAGMNYQSSRTVKGQPGRASRLQVPYKASDLHSWNTGDYLTFGRNGGILFTAGVGYLGAYAGINYLANGTFETTIRKVNSDVVIVEHKMIRLNNLGKSVGGGIVSVSLNKFKSLDTSWAFAVDISDHSTHDDYTKYVAGDVASLQNRGFNAADESVVALMKSKSVSRGYNFGISMAVPFLDSYTRGKIYKTSVTDVLADGSRVHAKSGNYMQNLKSSLFDYSRELSYGVNYAEVKRTQNGSSSSVKSANIIWNYNNTDTSAWRLRDAITELVRVTGMKDQLYVEVPQHFKDLGYASVKMDLKLYPSALNFLKSVGRTQRRRQALTTVGLGYVDSYFEHVSKYHNAAEKEQISFLGVCKNYGIPQMGESSRFNWGAQNAIEFCRDQVRMTTASALKKMRSALYKYSRAKNSNQRIESFVNFGKAMITNAFTFQTGFTLLKGRGIDMTYSIKGEKLKNYDITTSWNPTIQN